MPGDPSSRGGSGALMTPGVDDGGRAVGDPVGVPATVTLPVGAGSFCSTGRLGFGGGCTGFVARFGFGLAATCRAARRRSLAAVESPEPDGRRAFAASSDAGLAAGVAAGAVAGEGARVGAGFGADRHADKSNTLAKTTSP
jgi:hypothetical protein